MITSSHTKWPGFVIGVGVEIEHCGERESPRARVIDWFHAEGIDSAEGKSLICLPDKSLCLLGLGIIEHSISSHNPLPSTHTHKHTEIHRKAGSHAHIPNPNSQPSTNSTAHTVEEHLIFLRFNMSQVFRLGPRKSRQKTPLKKMSLLKNAFSVLYDPL